MSAAAQEDVRDEITQLVTIPPDTALAVFTTPGAIDPFLARIRKEVDGFVPDVTTAKGRKAIASMAYVVTQAKGYLEGVGKALADEQKEIPKKIDATRKKVKDTLDVWRDEVRKPLTDYETAEEARIEKHTHAITILNELSRMAPGRDSAGLRESLAYVEAVVIGPACEEFEADYTRARDAARDALQDALKQAETREAEQAELLKLREEKAKRDEADRIQKIKDDAAAEAKKLAEAAAQKALDDERAKTAAAEATARKVADDAAAAAALAKAAAQKIVDDAAAAQRLLDQKKAEEDAELARRERDKKHRAKIHTAAVEAFVAGGMKEAAAKAAVTLIAMKKIPAITISY